jgi:hypothetical protein
MDVLVCSRPARSAAPGSDIGEFDIPQLFYARLRDKQKALERLDRNYEEPRPLGTLLNVDPAFDSLRLDLRFGGLVRCMGLTPNARREWWKRRNASP